MYADSCVRNTYSFLKTITKISSIMYKINIFLIFWCAVMMQPLMGQGLRDKSSDISVPSADAEVSATTVASIMGSLMEKTPAGNYAAAETTPAMATGSPPAAVKSTPRPKAAKEYKKRKVARTHKPLFDESRFDSSMEQFDFHDAPKPRSPHRHKRQKRHRHAPTEKPFLEPYPLMQTEPPMPPRYPMRAFSSSDADTATSSRASPFSFYEKLRSPDLNFEVKVLEMLSPTMLIESVELKPYEHSQPTMVPQNMPGFDFLNATEYERYGDHSIYSPKKTHKRHSSPEKPPLFDILQPVLKPLLHSLRKMEMKTAMEMHNSGKEQPLSRRSFEDPTLESTY
ncbi:uncharacterized protein [Drosophila pseudoobscura]|uniref:Uncharacterized protein isoform X1 n=2 Tax=Drosophila pseudoobscura pseudoobscura TaxID=46245 RepID=B5DL50_DROPS|nr:uncharacterized protein LOC6902091 isoform X1 [Drosophila pseudoobscura]